MKVRGTTQTDAATAQSAQTARAQGSALGRAHRAKPPAIATGKANTERPRNMSSAVRVSSHASQSSFR